MLINLNKLKKSRKYKGAIAIEFALVMTFILVPLFLGTFEFGRLIYQYNSLAKSVRDSAKYISTQVYSSDLKSDYQLTYVPQAKCIAVYANIECTGNEVAPKLTTKDNIFIDPPLTVSGVKVITVMVSNYKPSLITNFLSSLGFVNFKFNNISVSMRQQE